MFKIFRIREYYPRAIRGLQILFILLKFFMVNWMSSKRWMLQFIPRQYKRDGVVMGMAERLRIVIEQLGPTFVKFGQILADRPDIVSEKLRNELKKLQNRAEPFEHLKAMEMIEEELGGPLNKFFNHIDNDCIGSASIGQVYKAQLKTGEDVIVKIQRPNIETKIELDLHILRYLAKQLVEEYPGLGMVDIIGVVDEFGDTLLRELNYLNEASNAIRFAEMFKNASYCKVPKVYLEMTTTRILVMEFVQGVSPDNVPELIANGIDPKVVAHNGTVMLLEMIFKHGFFHADPHAGNLFIDRNNTIILLDFGMAGTLKPPHMNFLAGFTLGLAMSNASMITDALLTLCDKKFFSEKDNLEFSVQDMLTRFGSFSYEKINFSQMLNECVKLILKYELKLPSSMYLLLKALATIEKFGYNLDPEISLPTIIRPYAEALIKEKFSARQVAGDIYDTMKDYVALIRDFPGEMNEILFKLKQGKITMEISLHEQQGIMNSIKEAGSIIGVVLIIAFMLGISAYMMVRGHDTTVVKIMFGTSLFFAVIMLLKLVMRSGK